MRTVLLLAVMSFVAASLTGCSDPNGPVLPPDVVSEVREFETIREVQMRTIGDINIREGETQEVIVYARENILPHIMTAVGRGRLSISMDQSPEPDHYLRIDITTPDLEGVHQEGIGSFSSVNTIVAERFYVTLNGIGDIDLRLDVERSMVEGRGFGTIRLSGESEYNSARLQSSVILDAYALATERTSVIHHGANDAHVRASDQLAVQIHGTGSVYYKGNPRLNTMIFGTGGIYDDN